MSKGENVKIAIDDHSNGSSFTCFFDISNVLNIKIIFRSLISEFINEKKMRKGKLIGAKKRK
jgi:hypothetical protein